MSGAVPHVQRSEFVFGFVNFAKIVILCSCVVNVFPVNLVYSDVTFN